MQVSVIEEQKKEASEEVDDETKPSDNDANDPSPVTSKEDGKPDVNDVPMEETEVRSKYLLLQTGLCIIFHFVNSSGI